MSSEEIIKTILFGYINRFVVKIGLREQAAQLAEKFSDYDILIKICDESGDNEKLWKYTEKFSEQVRKD